MIACAVLGFSWYFYFIALQDIEIKENSLTDGRLKMRNSPRYNLQRRCKIMHLLSYLFCLYVVPGIKNIYDADKSFTFP